MENVEEAVNSRSEYQRGYAAGRRRIEREDRRQATIAAQDEFWLQVFLASIPVLLASRDWHRGEKPMVTIADKISLAADAADIALQRAQMHMP